VTAAVTGAGLLDAAERFWDAHPDVATRARRAWTRGFASGAAWMEEVRKSAPRSRARPLRDNALGLLKNGGAALVAAGASLGALGAASALGGPLLGATAALPVFVLTFYAVEGQMVFLFPILHEARARGEEPSLLALLRACRARTVRAGGTLRVMRVVMPISARMITGGFLGRGFVSSWCAGCIAVVLWHESLASDG